MRKSTVTLAVVLAAGTVVGSGVAFAGGGPSGSPGAAVSSTVRAPADGTAASQTATPGQVEDNPARRAHDAREARAKAAKKANAERKARENAAEDAAEDARRRAAAAPTQPTRPPGHDIGDDHGGLRDRVGDDHDHNRHGGRLVDDDGDDRGDDHGDDRGGDRHGGRTADDHDHNRHGGSGDDD